MSAGEDLRLVVVAARGVAADHALRAAIAEGEDYRRHDFTASVFSEFADSLARMVGEPREEPER